MKSYFTFFCILTLFAASTFTNSFAQLPWERGSSDPVLSPGPAGSWDSWGVYAPFVLRHGDTLKMWYSGVKSGDLHQSGYAISFDGIDWQRDTLNPVLHVGTSGSWDAALAVHPYIIVDDTTYHMWYGGTDNPANTAFSIGYATSTDGIKWAKADSVNPVLDLGDPGEWDSATLAGHSYYFDGETFHMWYAGSDNLDYTGTCIGYATSSDGIHWEKYSGNPVFCGLGSWDSQGALTPRVIVDESGYKMWYSGNNGSYGRIGYATSPDGIVWAPSPSDDFVLDFGDSGQWDDRGVQHPHVILDDTTYHMWYSGFRSDTGNRIGHATASPTSIKNNDYKYIPNIFSLSQNYPNPFNPITNIEFQIPYSEFVTLRIYNLLGKEVATLVSNKLKSGNHTYHFDGRNLASGVYYYQLVAGEFQDVKKMILLR